MAEDPGGSGHHHARGSLPVRDGELDTSGQLHQLSLLVASIVAEPESEPVSKTSKKFDRKRSWLYQST